MSFLVEVATVLAQGLMGLTEGLKSLLHAQFFVAKSHLLFLDIEHLLTALNHNLKKSYTNVVYGKKNK